MKTGPLDHALALIERYGCAVVPVGFKTKHSMPTGWETLRIKTETEARKYFNGKAQNIGVLPGEPSGWLVDVDLDDPIARDLADAFLPPAPTFGRASNPRSHRLFIAKGAATRKYIDPLARADGERTMLVEIRSTGTMTVFPGSVHPSGEVVEWDGSDATKVPTLDAARLEENVGRLAAATLLVRYGWREGQRDDLITFLCGVLLRKDWPVELVDSYCKTIAIAGGDPNYDGLGKAARIKRALDGGGRKVPGATKLIKLLSAPVYDRIAEWLDLEKRVEPFPTSLVVPVGTFNALALPVREPIIEQVIVTRTLSMLYAPRGVGKTMAALQLAVSVASGTKFLAWSVPQPRRVLFVDGEMSASELQERLRRFCGDDTPEFLDVIASETFYQEVGAPLNLANIEHQRRFIALLDALNSAGRVHDLLILDNKSALTSGADENANSEQDVFQSFLRELRHRGMAVVLVHHAGKSGDQRGASKNEDFLDVVMKLELPSGEDEAFASGRGARFRLTFTKTRGLRPDPAELIVELMTDLDGSFTWAVEQPARVPVWLRVGAYIRDQAPATQAQIADALAVNKGDVSRAMKVLRGKRIIEPDSLALTASGRAYMDKARPKERLSETTNRD